MTPEERKRRHRNERIFATVVVLVIAAVTAGVVLHSQRIDEELAQQTTYVPTPTVITPEVELLQHYVRMDTSNPPGNELPAAEWLAGIIRQAGVEAEVIETAPGRGNVYARIEGTTNGGGLLLLHHIDVVPPGSRGWAQPPFDAKIQLDQMFGRGTLDMKGTAIAFLAAFLDVARRGRRPEHDLVFLGVADEERGSRWGMQWLVEHRPDVLEGITYALNEGGITEMSGEKATYYGIEIGTKNQSVIHLAAPTREQLQKARIALEPWFTPDRNPGRVLPEVRQFMRDVAPNRIEFREELSDIDKAIAAGKFWSLPVGYRELTQNNVWCQRIVAQPDGSFSMRVLLLTLPDEDPDRQIARVLDKVGPLGVELGSIERKEPPTPLSPIDTPFYKLLATEAASTYATRVGTEVLNRSGNDSRFLRRRGIAAYGINPFLIDFFQTETIHRSNERLRVAYFVTGVDFTRRLVSRYVFGE